MSDLISRSELLRKFSVNSNGDKIPEYDIDNFPVTLPIKDIKEMIRNQPTVSEQEIRNMAIEEFAEKLSRKIKSEFDDCAEELNWIDDIAEQMMRGKDGFNE